MVENLGIDEGQEQFVRYGSFLIARSDFPALEALFVKMSVEMQWQNQGKMSEARQAMRDAARMVLRQPRSKVKDGIFDHIHKSEFFEL